MISRDNSIMGQLCDYVSQAQKADLPRDVISKTKHHILDTFAAMVSGFRLKPGRLIVEYVQHQEGACDAQVVGSALLSSAVNAALANGIMAHSDETDDSHAPSMTHPGCAIVPAALAMAEREGCDGKTFINAVVLGYDVGCRVSRALVPLVYRSRGHCSHSIGGTFGAAAAAACVAGLDATQVRYALSYAAQQASGVGAHVGGQDHVEKAFVLGGMPARNGVTAATLVQAGFTGIADIFQGERNFLEAYSSDPRPEELIRGLGVHYEIMQTNIKKFSVGSPIQAALEALLQTIAENGLKAENVAHLVARLPEGEAVTVNNRPMPDINLQYILSVVLLDGKLSFEAAHSFERMRDPRVLEIMSRIELKPDPELTRARPPRQAVVEVSTGDGRHLIRRVVSVRGTAENPMTTEEVEKKAKDLISPVTGREKCDQLVRMVEEIQEVTDMRGFRSVLSV